MGQQSVVAGLIQLTLISFVPVVVFWVLFNHEAVGDRLLRLGRRVRLLRPPRPQPTGPPLEQIAADIRRIAADIAALPTRTPAVRRQGMVMAYDEALAAACRALDIPDDLVHLPAGPARTAERLKVECELEFAGLVIDPPAQAA